MMASTVLKFALLSRVLTFCLQVFFNWLLVDHSADAFRLRPLKDPTDGDKLVHFLLEGFNKWDGSYYLTIAEDGYSQPQMFVFFPFFPALVRGVASVIAIGTGSIISFRSSLMISSWFINTILFILAGNQVYGLGQKILKDDKMAFAAAVLFCINPASVFMSASYSEALFCFLTFWGMLAFQDQSFILSALLFGLSAASRSNGIVSFGFLIYFWTQQQIRTTLINLTAGKTNIYLYVILQSLKTALILLGFAVFIFGPFVMFQLYSFAEICHSQKFDFPSKFFQYILPVNGAVNTIPSSKEPDWCQKTLPLPYSNIQSDVWEVGFFNYFQLRKIPNFILATPVIVLSVQAISVYMKQNWEFVKWLGFLPQRKTWDKYAKNQGFFNEESFVYLAHLGFLLLFGVFVMHIEVITRFLFSSCPIILMFAAHVVTSGPKSGLLKAQLPESIMGVIRVIFEWFQTGPWAKFVIIYFIVYFILGIILHCNFLPWT
ncbi:GPI mannosyltransferase 2 [Holothuria leucospilota]|uniref:GPI mannosyltransferase 2 n=1 Tax=Holothuria leucospilota TaxID=206669 RepID=A0A9Q1CNC2_HOLLE|nr:GPI mannosyltransferase 2 [Holothuria leucospilota]